MIGLDGPGLCGQRLINVMDGDEYEYESLPVGSKIWRASEVRTVCLVLSVCHCYNVCHCRMS